MRRSDLLWLLITVVIIVVGVSMLNFSFIINGLIFSVGVSGSIFGLLLLGFYEPHICVIASDRAVAYMKGKPGIIYDAKDYTVSAFPVTHRGSGNFGFLGKVIHFKN